jgi:aspartokinase/homoserine dehydrogenase 1
MSSGTSFTAILDEGEEIRVGFGGRAWQVHKFGGTSVANAECFLAVARIVEDQLFSSAITITKSNVAVVVSAMGGKPKVTDLLLDAVKFAAQRDSESVKLQLGLILDKHRNCLVALFPGTDIRDALVQVIESDIEDIRDILKTVALMKWQAERISELVSGYGEVWSAQILTALLKYRCHQRKEEQGDFSSLSLHMDPTPLDHQFVYLDARRVITVDEEAIQDGAVAWQESATKLESVFEHEQQKLMSNKSPEEQEKIMLHFIITGYVASNTHGVSTTLKRDGSDYSAAIIGRLVESNAITIWTDVDGVLSADPRLVPLAQVLTEVSYNEAMELAYFGAKVIHPKTMQPAIMSHPQIPIYIRNTFNPSLRGTRIFTSSPKHRDRDRVVCGFTSIDSMALINVEGSGMVGARGMTRRIFMSLEQVGISVVLISQASSEHSVTFALVESASEQARHAIQEEFARELRTGRISKVDLQAPCSIIAAVGDGMSHTTGVSGLFFSALGDAKINILAIAQGSSERNISAVVRTEDSPRALRAVHAAFRLSHTTIRVGIVGMTDELGDSLLKLLNDRRAALRTTFEIDLQVVAVLASSESNELVCLKKDVDGGSDSITIDSFNNVTGGSMMLGSSAAASVSEGDGSEALSREGGLSNVLLHLVRNECTNHVIFDCTNDEVVGRHHASWLRAGVDVVTANNTGLSGPKEQRDEISEAEKALGKQSAKYLRAVTVGGGLPIINTVRTLLETGDNIRRIDGILSVSSSFIMFRISPPPDISRCSEFDENTSNGAFRGDLMTSPSVSIGTACSFSQAVKEAIALGLMEGDPTKDLNNEYTSRVLMILARELGIRDVETAGIQSESDKLLDEAADFNSMSAEIDQKMQDRVDAARSRGCVLRQISSVDVAERRVEIKIVEVPEHHIFAVTPPSCECVRFFTHRHRRYPLIVQGPSAGADSTASALLAELLQLMKGKATPRAVSLSRTATSAALRSSFTK